MMNSYIKSLEFLIIAVIAVFLFGCEKEIEGPSVSITATPSTVNAGEMVTFDITGDAETFAIFTGDDGHNYDSSFLVIADGKDLDLGVLVLTNQRLDIAEFWLELEVKDFNEEIKSANEDLRNDTTILESDKIYQDTVVFDDLIASLKANIVGVEFPNADNASYNTAIAMFGMVDTAEDLVDDFFEDQGTYLAPAGGYHKGVALNRFDLGYTYVYDTPGTYVATVVATNISTKKYSGDGYKTDRSATASEYNFERVIRQVTIVVN